MTHDIPLTRLSLLAALHDPLNREAAWHQFNAAYAPVIYRWCRKWGVSRDHVEEVSAVIIVHVFQHICQYVQQPGKHFRSWLQTVVHNKVYDHFRYLNRHPDQALGGSDALDVLHSIEAPEAAADLATELDERMERLFQATLESVRAAVDPQTWHAFYLRICEGLPANEIAEKLTMTPAAVFQATYRVRNMIRKKCALWQGDGEVT